MKKAVLVPYPKPHVPDEVWEWDLIHSVKKNLENIISWLIGIIDMDVINNDVTAC